MSQLSENIEASVAGTQATDSDIITNLRESLEATQAELDSQKHQNQLLEAEINTLRDNTEIKRSTFRYARVFMWLLPATFLTVFLASVTKSLQVQFCGEPRVFEWDVEIGSYTEAALIVGPLVFITTVLGLLLRGVFGQPASTDDTKLSNLVEVLQGKNSP